MLQFPIKCLLDFSVKTFRNETKLKIRKIISLSSSSEWTINCFSKPAANWMEPDFVEIRRVNISEEMLIFGTFSLEDRSQRMLPKQKFSKIMESRSSTLVIHFNVPLHKEHCYPYHLSGDLNIMLINDITTNKYNGPKNCAHMMECLLKPQSCYLSDVNLKCGSESIPAHKNILSKQSPVFAAMFNSSMRENLENEVNIIDMDVSSLRIMLTYMYTGKMSTLNVLSASELLFAAEKYQLQKVKEICCDFLKINISRRNVLKIIVLGELLAEDLKSCAMNYICNKCTKFSVLEETEDWKNLRKDRPALAIDILTYVLKSRDENPNKRRKTK